MQARCAAAGSGGELLRARRSAKAGVIPRRRPMPERAIAQQAGIRRDDEPPRPSAVAEVDRAPASAGHHHRRLLPHSGAGSIERRHGA